MPTLDAGTAIVRSLLVAALVVLGAVALSGPVVLAHSWYPAKCCSGEDCRKVDWIEWLPDGDQLFHVGSISVVVPAEFLRLPSEDNETHVCVYRINTGAYRPRCVFVPGAT